MVVEALMPPDAARVATVYTNAPKWRREARPSHLCALLRSQGHPQPKPTTQQCTQTPQNGAERPDPPICVHYCVPTSARTILASRNSVHKCPKTAPRGLFQPICVHSCVRRPGGEAHIAGAMTQPPTHTNLRSLSLWVASLGARSKTSPILSVWPTSPHRRNRPLSLRP